MIQHFFDHDSLINPMSATLLAFPEAPRMVYLPAKLGHCIHENTNNIEYLERMANDERERMWNMLKC